MGAPKGQACHQHSHSIYCWSRLAKFVRRHTSWKNLLWGGGGGGVIRSFAELVLGNGVRCGVVLFSWKHTAMSGDIFSCYNLENIGGKY